MATIDIEQLRTRKIREIRNRKPTRKEVLALAALPGRWKVIHDLPDYEVSEWGSVRRCRPGYHTRVGRVITPWKNNRGYLCYTLVRDKVQYTLQAHTLVAEAFLGPRPHKKEVCHGDANKGNNHLSNLRWGSHLENTEDSKRHGSIPLGEGVGTSRLTAGEVLALRYLVRVDGFSCEWLAQFLNYRVTAKHIDHITSKRSPTRWKWLPECSLKWTGTTAIAFVVDREDAVTEYRKARLGGPKRKLTPQQECDIRRRIEAGEKQDDVARIYAVAQATIHRIINRPPLETSSLPDWTPISSQPAPTE